MPENEGGEAGSLMLRFLPRWQFAEVHGLFVPAAPGVVLDAASRREVLDDPLARGLIAIRELPGRLAGRLGFASALRQREAFGFGDFVALGRDGDRELAFGLAGRFWRADYGLLKFADAREFAAYDGAGAAKLVLNFRAEAAEGGTRLTTRTRVFCGDAASKRRFFFYWCLIRPASGWIRQRLLERVREAALGVPASP